MEIKRVKIINPNDSWCGTECFVNGHKISNVRSVDFYASAGEVPHFTFEVYGIPEIDMPGTVQFEFTLETIQQAAVILKNEFENNPESKKAFIASIASVLREIPKESGLYDVAERIANRIVGFE